MEALEEDIAGLRTAGKYVQALEKLETLLSAQIQTNGAESPEAARVSSQICEMCNVLAMHRLQTEDYSAALDLLKRAEAASDRSDEGRAITCNNLACYYKKVGKTRSALSYLQKAQAIEDRLETAHSPANTHLNMCAVLSQIGKHNSAREEAMLAIILLQDELLLLEEGGRQEKAGLLAIAYHNLAVEMEHLKRVTVT
jgi:tetratricopeptide (TPR) repeat protein